MWYLSFTSKWGVPPVATDFQSLAHTSAVSASVDVFCLVLCPEILKLFLIWSSCPVVPQSPQFVTRLRDLTLAVKNKAIKALSTPVFSMQFVITSFASYLHYLSVSLVFLHLSFRADHLWKLFFLSSMFLGGFDLSCVAFLIWFWNAWMMLLDFLVTSFLCLSSARTFIFSQSGFPLYLSISLCNHNGPF